MQHSTEPPKPPTAPRTWPWHQWSDWQILWVFLSRFVIAPVLAIFAIATAATYLVQNVPAAKDKFFWREVEYRKLRQLHAGFSVSYITSKLGEPALVKNVTKQPILNQYLYLRRDHIVQLVVNSSGEAVLFSVLSCDGGFRPQFDTPAESVVTLQDRPLSQAEQPAGDSPAASELAKRNLAYHPGSTVSSPDILVEQGYVSGSGAVRDRGYYFGVNGLCADIGSLAEDPVAQLSYEGSVEKANPPVKSTRESVAANFYTETVDEIFILRENGFLALHRGGNPSRSGEVSVSPYHFDLPGSAYKPAGTNTFPS